ncbi:MAG: 4-hydroxythreonine-4-phosphate dehydrogenase PdxA [Pseudomonadota bacterium]|nr:4-hydroxythreonine-4-phosphate dehydrogenase PdxA [Pseudomonadota bacterium]
MVTPGEPAGIGPDLVLQWAAEGHCLNAELAIVADPAMLAQRARQLGLEISCVIDPHLTFAPIADGALRVLPVPLARSVRPGVLDPDNSAGVITALHTALQACLDGRADALVTGPMQKSVINDAGIPFSGHTEYLAEHSGGDLPVMLLTAGTLRVALVTTHLPLRAVADAITLKRIVATARVLHHDLIRHFDIAAPRILVCGLNPHAGESGHLGHEEAAIITPALQQLRAEGINVIGPLPADTLFTPQHLDHADAVLAMYHDQGLPTLKYAGFGEAVNVTLGLPLLRTSVDHGTALDLAGTGRALGGSFAAALRLAAQLAARRRGPA